MFDKTGYCKRNNLTLSVTWFCRVFIHCRKKSCIEWLPYRVSCKLINTWLFFYSIECKKRTHFCDRLQNKQLAIHKWDVRDHVLINNTRFKAGNSYYSFLILFHLGLNLPVLLMLHEQLSELKVKLNFNYKRRILQLHFM